MAAVVFQPTVGQVLCSSSTKYTIIEFVGEGRFGIVAKCRVNSTRDVVAVKILKETFAQHVAHELSMLHRISALNPDQYNLVKFYERFEYIGYTCLVFELLVMDLLQFINTEPCFSMCVHQIRPIAKQLLITLQGLQSCGIIHTDIKLDNVMLAYKDDLYYVKLIDFGQAIPFSAAKCGRKLQPIGSRAPEICLGLPFSEAIDMWGLGCVLACLYLEYNLFPVNCEYLMIQSIVEIFGMPPDDQLLRGVHTKRFFCQEEDEHGTQWRFLTPEEYSADQTTSVEEWPTWRPHFKSLDDLLYIYKKEDAEEFKDRIAFIHFLKQVLHQDGRERISPNEALQHPFITMSHLSQDPDNSDYLTKAQRSMSMKCTFDDMDEEHEVQLSPGHLLPSNSWESVEVPREQFVKVLLAPASSQIEHLNNDNRSVKEPSLDLGVELESGMWTLTHCDENLDSVSLENGPVVEDVPSPTSKRFKKVQKFFCAIKTMFLCCFCTSAQK